MQDPLHIACLFDPLCGWCYGAQPVLAQLASRKDVTLELVPVGLFAGEGARPMSEDFAAYAWSNDQRIARLTGQLFSEDYRRRVLADQSRLFDSGPASLAITAVFLSEPTREVEALGEIQRVRYVAGRDNTDVTVLSEVLAGLGLNEAAARLLAPDDALRRACHRRINDGRARMRLFSLDGVPALIAGNGEGARPVPSAQIFGGIDALMESLKGA